MERRQRVKAYINRHFGVDADIRAPFEVITQLRSEGIDAVPSIIPRLLLGEEKDGAKRSVLSVNGHEVLPLSGMSDRVTVLCNEPGEYVTYHSDQNGLHNPPGVWESGRVDIVAIGDSFTQGYCVPSDKNFVALIRKDHPATLNLGMAGEGPLQMLGAFEEYAARFNPKVVLWFYFEGNDLIDLQDERKSPLLMQYLNEGFKQDLLGRKADVDRGIAGYIERETVAEEKKRAAIKPDGRFDKWVYIAKLSSLRERLGLVYGSDAEQAQVLAEVTGEAVDLFRRVMTLAKERVSAHGGRLYFVYLPEWTRYKGNLGSAEKQREPVLQIVNDLGIPVIDVHPLFQSHKDPMSLFPFSAPGHYTEEGHRLVAEQVLKALASSK
jgi:hypothetical protein